MFDSGELSAEYVERLWETIPDDDGPRSPEIERRMLVGGEATGPPYCASGRGLWLVYATF
jgi:hypothetical protein